MSAALAWFREGQTWYLFDPATGKVSGWATPASPVNWDNNHEEEIVYKVFINVTKVDTYVGLESAKKALLAAAVLNTIDRKADAEFKKRLSQ